MLPAVRELPGAVRKSMPVAVHPMLATSVEEPFDDPEWLFEIKWDGYRAVSFIQNGKVRLVSRNQNDLTGEFPELHELSDIRQRRKLRSLMAKLSPSTNKAVLRSA